ncbi:hypothetical protein B5F41_11730 [Gordonibacter sp. An232A]|nr:hypothetical protein B5F41_11730 [Gordonibacter sp. An232A]
MASAGEASGIAANGTLLRLPVALALFLFRGVCELAEDSCGFLTVFWPRNRALARIRGFSSPEDGKGSENAQVA